MVGHVGSGIPVTITQLGQGVVVYGVQKIQMDASPPPHLRMTMSPKKVRKELNFYARPKRNQIGFLK